MINNSCFGLLGLAGNYRNIEFLELKKTLKFALKNYDLVDLSLDYGIKYNLVDAILQLHPESQKSDYILKVACNFEAEYNSRNLAKKTVGIIEKIGEHKIKFILSHRPSYEKISSDIKFFEIIKKSYPKIKFGICTNNKDIYREYKKLINIDIVQMALNPLDFASNRSFIEVLLENATQVQARSILCNGLLSGKYSGKSQFDDLMRQRYQQAHLKIHFQEKMRIIGKVINELEREFGDRKATIPIILYSIFEKLPFIKFVIRGGCTMTQITENLQSTKVEDDYLERFVCLMNSEWDFPYV